MAWRGCAQIVALVASLGACAPADSDYRPPATEPAIQRDLTVELADIDACGYVGCRGPFHFSNELDVGEYMMGTVVPRTSGERLGTCTQGHFQGYGPGEMCGFTRDGVIYVLLDGKVVGKDIDVENPPVAGLPFGLRRGQTPEETLVSLRAHSDVPFDIRTFPGGDVRYVGHDNVLKNANAHPFLFSLLFANDRLMRIVLQDPSAPAD